MQRVDVIQKDAVQGKVKTHRLRCSHPPQQSEASTADILGLSCWTTVSSTRRSMGKRENRRPADGCARESPEQAEIRAGHANVSNVETGEIGYVVGRT